MKNLKKNRTFFDGRDLQIGEDLTIIFNEEMSGRSINSNNLIIKNSNGTVINGDFSLSTDKTKVTFNPVAPLKLGETFRIYIDGVKDRAGNKIIITEMTIKTFKPEVIASINTGRVNDMDILHKNKDYLIVFDENSGDKRWINVNINHAEQPEIESIRPLGTNNDGIFKIAPNLLPITFKDITGNSKTYGGDFLLSTHQMYPRFDDTGIFKKTYPGGVFLDVYNINDPLNPELIDSYALSLTSSETSLIKQPIPTTLVGQNAYIIGMTTTVDITGGNHMESGTLAGARDIETNFNAVAISNWSRIADNEENRDLLVGIQTKILDGNPDNININLETQIPNVQENFLSDKENNTEQFLGLDSSLGILLAVNKDVEEYIVSPGIFKKEVKSINFGITGVPGYQIDLDHDRNLGQAEDSDNDSVKSIEETFDLAVVGCELRYLCVYKVYKYSRNGRELLADIPLIARIPLIAGTSGFISVDKEKKLAFVPDLTAGLLIVDLRLDRVNQKEMQGLIDKDGDGRDDRILWAGYTGENDGISKTILDVDEDGKKVVYVRGGNEDIKVVQVEGCNGNEENPSEIGDITIKVNDNEIKLSKDIIEPYTHPDKIYIPFVDGLHLSAADKCNNNKFIYTWTIKEDVNETIVNTRNHDVQVEEPAKYDVELKITCDTCTINPKTKTAKMEIIVFKTELIVKGTKNDQTTGLPVIEPGTKFVESEKAEIEVKILPSEITYTNFKLQLSAEWERGTGGHSHEKGGTLRALPKIEDDDKTLKSSPVELSANNNFIRSKFKPSEGIYEGNQAGISGKYTVKVVYKGKTKDTTLNTQDILVKYDLEKLVEGDYYYLQRKDVGHNEGDYHYGTTAANTAIKDAAKKFWDDYGSKQTPQRKLVVNDQSLPLGGLFDAVDGDWNPAGSGHQTHREGKELDIPYSYYNGGDEPVRIDKYTDLTKTETTDEYKAILDAIPKVPDICKEEESKRHFHCKTE